MTDELVSLEYIHIEEFTFTRKNGSKIVCNKSQENIDKQIKKYGSFKPDVIDLGDKIHNVTKEQAAELMTIGPAPKFKIIEKETPKKPKSKKSEGEVK